jgi:hypothetical protein
LHSCTSKKGFSQIIPIGMGFLLRHHYEHS